MRKAFDGPAIDWPFSNHVLPCLPPGAIQTFISCPVELLKIRLQLQRAKPGTAGYIGPLGMLRQVVAHEGVAGGWGTRTGLSSRSGSRARENLGWPTAYLQLRPTCT